MPGGKAECLYTPVNYTCSGDNPSSCRNSGVTQWYLGQKRWAGANLYTHFVRSVRPPQALLISRHSSLSSFQLIQHSSKTRNISKHKLDKEDEHKHRNEHVATGSQSSKRVTQVAESRNVLPWACLGVVFSDERQICCCCTPKPHFKT